MEICATQAKRQFTLLIERVQQGERITITVRGRPVTELVPLGPDEIPRFCHVWSEMMTTRELRRSALD